MAEDILFISKERIQEQVERLALDISNYCEETKISTLSIVWVAEGAMFFVADLVRHFEGIDTEFVSIKASSYGINTSSSGNVILGGIPNLQGKDILLIDDILDTGNTLKAITDIFKAQGVKSCKICVLLDKNKAEQDIIADFKAFDIEDEFVFGYGLDLAGKRRNTQDIFYRK